MYGPVNLSGNKCKFCGQGMLVFPHHCKEADDDFERRANAQFMQAAEANGDTKRLVE